MVVFALAQNAIIFVLLDYVEGNKGITSAVLNGFSKNTILVVAAKGVHEDVGLGRGHMYTATTFVNGTSLDLCVVALGNFEPRSEHILDCDTLDLLLGTLALQVDAHHLAVLDLRVLDLDGVVWVGQAVDGAGPEVLELCVGYENIGVDQNAGSIMVLLVSEQLTAGQVDESTGERDQDREPRLEFLLV